MAKSKTVRASNKRSLSARKITIRNLQPLIDFWYSSSTLRGQEGDTWDRREYRQLLGFVRGEASPEEWESFLEEHDGEEKILRLAAKELGIRCLDCVALKACSLLCAIDAASLPASRERAERTLRDLRAS